MKLKTIFIGLTILSLTACGTTKLTVEQAIIEDKIKQKEDKLHIAHLIKYCSVIDAGKAQMVRDNEDVKLFSHNPECLYYREHGHVNGYDVKKYKAEKRGFDLFGIKRFKDDLVASSNLMGAFSAKAPAYVKEMSPYGEELYKKVSSHGISQSAMQKISKQKTFSNYVRSYEKLIKQSKAIKAERQAAGIGKPKNKIIKSTNPNVKIDL